MMMDLDTKVVTSALFTVLLALAFCKVAEVGIDAIFSLEEPPEKPKPVYSHDGRRLA